MGWKCYANNPMTLEELRTATAEKLSEIFGSCVADTTGVTLSYGGNDYVVPISYSSNLTTYKSMLFVNDETGSFILSFPTSTYPKFDYNRNYYIYGALLEIQTESNKTELVPCNDDKKYYARALGLMFNSGVSGDYNVTDFVSLVPLTTGGLYNTAVARSLFRPVVGLFNSNVSGISVGAVIEVSGQQFMCVSAGLFVKL
jgi:hypothetical protein